jgi:uncharacterized membrane protein YeaQ/YmgE (transglycosylase-associated protein family)
MLILVIIVLGLAAGWVAQLLLGRADSRNWTEAMVAGIVGSFVGGLIASLLAGDGLRLRPSGFIGSVLGAVIVLAIWAAVRGRSRSRSRRR